MFFKATHDETQREAPAGGNLCERTAVIMNEWNE
jgi:hypothetical protein